MPQVLQKKRATRLARALQLTQEQGLTIGKAAEVLGVSRMTLHRDLALVDQQQVLDDLKTYGSVLRSELPISTRATKLIALTDSDNPFAALRALERADALCGIHAEPPKDSATAAPQVPLFALPAGTRVAIQLGPTPTGPPERDSGK